MASTSEKMETAEAGACCPAAAGLTCAARWTARRMPHALRAAALVVVAFAGAALSNAVNPRGIPWLPSPGNRVGIPRAFEDRLPEIDGRGAPTDPSTRARIGVAPQALALYEAGEAVFVDSRDAGDYGRDHIPGAINVPMRRWAEVWPDMEPELPRDRTLVLYCYGAHCGLSTRQGKALLEEGYEKLVVLDYGWGTWTKHGFPTVDHPDGHPGGEGGH